MNGEEKVARDPIANALAKLLAITQLSAANGDEASLTELSQQAMRFVRDHVHDHVTCEICNQIYRDAYRTGYMHAGGDTSRLPSREENDDHH